MIVSKLILVIAGVTNRVVFLYRVLLGIASYSEQSLTIRSRLYGVEYFCYSEQVMWSRIFLLFRVGYAGQSIFAIPVRLYQVEYFRYSEQLIPSRRFLLFRVGYVRSRTFVLCYSEQVISAIPGWLQRMFILSRNFLVFCVV